MQKLITFSLLSFLVLTSISLFAQNEYGLASYYGDEFHGRTTAYGDTYDKAKLTAAHKKHPNGTILKVIRIDNNQSVTVRVNDKGPFVKGRIIDLSRAAAEKIGLVQAGLTEVKIEVLGKKSYTKTDVTEKKKIAKPSAVKDKVAVVKEIKDRTSSLDEYAVDTHKAEKEKAVARARAKEKAEALRKKEAAIAKAAADKLANLPEGKKAKKSTASKKAKEISQVVAPVDGVYKIIKDAPDGYTVQVASSGSHKLMEAKVSKLKGKWFKKFILTVEEHKGNPKFNVGLGTFDKMKSAQNYQKNLKKKYKIEGFVTPVAEEKTDAKKPAATKLNLAGVESDKFGVQVSSLKTFNRFLKEYNKLDGKGFDNIMLGLKSDGTFKAILGPFDSKEQAKTYQKNLVKKYKIKGFVINLEDFK